MSEAPPQAAAGNSDGIATAVGTDRAQGEQGAPQDAETSAAEDPALSALIYGWGDAYEIWHDEAGWHARRRDGLGEVMTEDQPDALYKAIFDNYTMKAVPRDLPAEADR